MSKQAARSHLPGEAGRFDFRPRTWALGQRLLIGIGEKTTINRLPSKVECLGLPRGQTEAVSKSS